MATAEAEAPPKKSKKKLIIIVVAVVLVLGAAGAAYFYGMQAGKPKEEPPPEPGAMLHLDPITVNLADGAFLKVGVALQLTAEASAGDGHGAAPDGAIALDLIIDEFSGRPVEELGSKAARDKAKEHLLHEMDEPYHHGVMDLYFTEFVMQ